MIVNKALHLIGCCMILSASLAFARPNKKNQISNEASQSAPYALESVDEPRDSHGPESEKDAAQSVSNKVQPDDVAKLQSSDKSTAESESLVSHYPDPMESQGSSGSSVHLDPDSSRITEAKDSKEAVLGLQAQSSAPIHQIEAVSQLAESGQTPAKAEPKSEDVSAESSETVPLKANDDIGFVSAKHEHKPQLPVTNSHLKKPIISSIDFADSLPQATGLAIVANSSSNVGSGAKSLVSPTVNSEDQLPEQKVHKGLKKTPGEQPDVLLPFQKVADTSNVGSIPGIVNREYGHQSRTRITLGGGYVRDRLPPLVNPASSSYVDDKPEKPVAPLEKIKSSSVVSSATSKPDNKQEEQKRKSNVKAEPASEVASESQKQSQEPAASKPHPRCPKAGAITMSHPTACDKYYLCSEGKLTEHTCPNGLMYGTRDQDIVREQCVHRWKADCGDKTIPNPISSPGCRWQYGIFNVQGSPKCSPDYYECYAGRYEVRKCSVEGQVYDDRTKSCQFAEIVGCTSEVLPDFQCPLDDQANTYWPFPRYFLNEHALIHCVNDKPEIVRCPQGERVDPEHLHCVPAAGIKAKL